MIQAGMPVRYLSALLLLFVACARPTPAPAAADDVSATADWRRSLAGDWIVEFRLDSVRSRGPTQPWQAGSFRSARGTLQLSDSTTSRNLVHSHIDVTFDSLLVRPMSCYDPRPTTTAVERNGDAVSLHFTPNAADCGFSASGTLRGDSLIGTWDESGFAGPTVMGRFRMFRAPR
jgi:hypothetical protein